VVFVFEELRSPKKSRDLRRDTVEDPWVLPKSEFVLRMAERPAVHSNRSPSPIKHNFFTSHDCLTVGKQSSIHRDIEDEDRASLETRDVAPCVGAGTVANESLVLAFAPFGRQDAPAQYSVSGKCVTPTPLEANGNHRLDHVAVQST
jgi:hypothetical protein